MKEATRNEEHSHFSHDDGPGDAQRAEGVAEKEIQCKRGYRRRSHKFQETVDGY